METRPLHHPSIETLHAFGSGQLDDQTADSLVAHLEACPPCRARAASLTGDSFLDRLRAVQQRRGTVAPASGAAATVDFVLPAKPDAAQPAPPVAVPPELREFKQYEVIRELGRGGMGVVYLAKNTLMGRFEVLKLVNTQLLDNTDAAARFLREICSAASLNHPNIVTAYAALQSGESLVLAMEYVEGEDLAKVVHEHGPLPLVNACYYAQQAAMGLQHAFEKGMVHRDIKPQNLILARGGKKHIVKILDFGLAKATHEKDGPSQDLPGANRKLTRVGAIMGTPDYIAPEQILDAASADIRADLYSLGCTLYVLLTGKPPFRDKSLDGLLLAHQSQQAAPVNEVRPEAPAELAAVVARLLAKDPAQRYQKPVEVAQALAPFAKHGLKPLPAAPKPATSAGSSAPSPETAAGDPRPHGSRTVAGKAKAPSATMAGEKAAANQVSGQHDAPTPALRPTMIERSPTIARAGKKTSTKSGRSAGQKPSKQLQLGVALGIAMLLAVAIGLCVPGVFRAKPLSLECTLVVTVNQSYPDVYVDGESAPVTWSEDGKIGEIHLQPGTREVEVRKERFKASRQMVDLLSGTRHVLSAELLEQVAPVEPKKGIDPPQVPVEAKRETDPPPVSVENKKTTDPPPLPVEVKKQGNSPPLGKVVHPVESALLQPGGYFVLQPTRTLDHLLLAGSDLKLYELGKQDLRQYGPSKVGPDRAAIALTPDGNRFYAAYTDHEINLYDLATGQRLAQLAGHDPGKTVTGLALTPDGKTLISTGTDRLVRLWDTATQKPIVNLSGHTGWVQGVGVSPDGRRAVTSSKNEIILWDLDNRHLLRSANWFRVADRVAFAPGGRILFHERDYGQLGVLDAQTLGFLTVHKEGAWTGPFVFTPSGRYLLAYDNDEGAIQMWEYSAMRVIRNYQGTAKRVTACGVALDGQFFYALGDDNMLHKYPLNDVPELVVSVAAPETKNAEGSPPVPPVKSPPNPPPVPIVDKMGKYESPGYVHFGADAARVVLRYNDFVKQNQHFAQVYNMSTGLPVTPRLKHDSDVRLSWFSADGRRVVTAGVDTAQVWDAATGRALSPPLKHERAVCCATFSPDGDRVVTGCFDGTAQVWDAATGLVLTRVPRRAGIVTSASFSPDGKRVVTAGDDKTARVWDSATGNPVCPPLQHLGGISSATFSPDGQRVLTASNDNTARVWDAASGEPLTRPLTHDGRVWHAMFSPDGKRVITPSEDKTARVWDAATGQALIPALKHDARVNSAAFSPDGKRVLTASDRTARVWDAATGQALTPPLMHTGIVGDASWSPDGRQVITFSLRVISTTSTTVQTWTAVQTWDAVTGKSLKRIDAKPSSFPPP